MWYVWLPNYRPSLRAGERYGVDVSHHQGPIDWQRVAADGIDAAYIKATEGGDHVDSRFADNWKASARAGIVRGAYHFFTFCRGGAEQAANFLRTVPTDPDALAPAVDLEFAGNCSRRPDKDEFIRELRAYVDIVEASTGKTAVLYLHDNVDRRYGVRDALDRPLWQLRFVRRPRGDWAVWQVQAFARVDGIDGGVDLDVFRPAMLGSRTSPK